MDAAVQVILSGALTFGVPLVLAVHELLALRRRGGDRRDDRGPAPHPPKPPPYDWDAPLPDCLVPKRSAQRQLEDA